LLSSTEDGPGTRYLHFPLARATAKQGS